MIFRELDCLAASWHSTAGESGAEEWIPRYEQCEKELSDRERGIVKVACKKVVTTSGLLHPSGVMLVPEGIEISDYAPLDMDAERKEELTGYYPSDEEIKNMEFTDLFADNGILGIPGFFSTAKLELLRKLKPKTYAELAKLECLCHGTGVCENKAEVLIAEGKVDLSTIIASREDVFECLLSYEMDREETFWIAESVRREDFPLTGRGRSTRRTCLSTESQSCSCSPVSRYSICFRERIWRSM